jgi:hypothetical protein
VLKAKGGRWKLSSRRKADSRSAPFNLPTIAAAIGRGRADGALPFATRLLATFDGPTNSWRAGV